MRVLAVCASIICLVGCTTLRPIIDRSSELQQRIVSEGLVKPGDHLQIATIDRKIHQLTVISIDANTIVGERESIAMNQIVSIERREFSLRRTLTLVGVTILGILVVIVAVGLHHGVGLPAGAA